MTRRPLEIEIGEIAINGFDRADTAEAGQALQRELARQIVTDAEPGGDVLAASIARAVRQRLSG